MCEIKLVAIAQGDSGLRAASYCVVHYLSNGKRIHILFQMKLLHSRLVGWELCTCTVGM